MAAGSIIPLFQVPPAVTRRVVLVRLDSGAIVERDPGELVAVPGDLTLGLEGHELPTP